MIEWKKILYWICGIWNGHTFRQLTILEELHKTNIIQIFAYWNSLEYLSRYFKSSPNIFITEVDVPFYIWDKTGLSFNKTSKSTLNLWRNFFKKNIKAMEIAQSNIWQPDFVISDYEPVSAQYAYAYDVPLFTIDQQSKFFNFNQKNKSDSIDVFPSSSYLDETMRLNMFFPKATERFACSFYKVKSWKAKIVAPIIRKEIQKLKPSYQESKILVYLSPNKLNNTYIPSLANDLWMFPAYNFKIFTSWTDKIKQNLELAKYQNLEFIELWDLSFIDHLWSSNWVISTSGHNLISEALYLEKPIYAIPGNVLEQKLNAHMISQSWFGLSSNSLNKSDLSKFLKNLSNFRKNIQEDNKVLTKGIWQDYILNTIEKYLQ